MKKIGGKKSFPLNTLEFLKKLSKNNNKEWFEENRELFNSDLLQPALQFVVDLGEKLKTIAPDIIAVPKIDKSIFRLHRDVRFSKDKSPYKTNLGIYFWEGKRKKMECSGLYFHIDPKSYFLGTGMYMLSNDLLKAYREKIYDPVLGKELNDTIKKVMKKGVYGLGGKTYKRVPKGYDPDYPYADYLLHSGFYIYYEGKNIGDLVKDPVSYSFKIYKDMLPVHKWLVKNLG
jgi:uncharacterized protein (TIGR02453 family)